MQLHYFEQIVLQRFPVMVKWPSSGVRWSHLMFEESEAMLTTIESLMLQDIPAYSVHDSLIVPRKHNDKVNELLLRNFESRFGVPFNVT